MVKLSLVHKMLMGGRGVFTSDMEEEVGDGIVEDG
jgi:hypothetical protein